MSLSNPTEKNPATKFIDWSGSVGKFKYYDKEKGENGENIFFENPIYIIPLDELSAIKGFDKVNGCGYYSNEIKYLDKEILFVKSFKGGKIATGLYKDLKLPAGCKFGKSIYAAMITGDKTKTELELVNFQMVGSALGSWIDAKVSVDSGNVVILSPSMEVLTNGNTEYFAPKIVKSKKRDDILAKCIDMDRELQKYLNTYLNKDHSDIQTKPEENVKKDVDEKKEHYNDKFEDLDDLPF